MIFINKEHFINNSIRTVYKHYSLQQYLEVLSQKTPVPGGGSAAALTGALGVALLSMVAHYSKGKDQSKTVEDKFQEILKGYKRIRLRLLELVDLDARAYLRVLKSRHTSSKEKKSALKMAKGIPQEVCQLCYRSVKLMPFLVRRGNKNLISDVEVALELLLAAYNSAFILVKYNELN